MFLNFMYLNEIACRCSLGIFDVVSFDHLA